MSMYYVDREMSLYYVTEEEAIDGHALPSILVSRFTSVEVAKTMEDEIYSFMRRPAFRLAWMNRQEREAMLDTMVRELDIEGGFMWCVCPPGCMPDSDWTGPFATEAEAVANAREYLTGGVR